MQRRHFIVAGSALALGAWTTAGASGGSPRAQGARVLVVGDSLSAEYGLRRGSGWVALLAERVSGVDASAQVINASISGDTTAGGRSRLGALLQQHEPTHVVIELGGNDALRGLPLNQSADNLRDMTRRAQQAGAQVLLVGIQVPPNYGRQYTQQFEAMFEQVAKDTGADLVPFLLKNVADRPDAADFFQSDRIHPNEQAQPIMLDNVWPALQALLKGPRPGPAS